MIRIYKHFQSLFFYFKRKYDSIRDQDIILVYSKKHFHPLKKTNKEETSAGQLAYHMYHMLKKKGDVFYSDHPVFNSARLIITNRVIDCNTRKIQKLIFFPAISHIEFTNAQLTKWSNKLNLDAKELKYFSSDEKIKAFRKFVDNVDKIVIIGNKTVLNSYLSNGVLSSKLILLDCGVDISSFIPYKRAENHIDFLFFATSPSLLKGFPFFIETWKQLIDKYGDKKIHLTIIGQLYNGDFSISPYTHIKGISWYDSLPSERIPPIIGSCHYVILPSLSEGQAGSLLEAMSAGCLPIATKYSGINAEEYFGWNITDNDLSDLEILLNSIIINHNSEFWIEKSQKLRLLMEKRHSWDRFRDNLLSAVFDQWDN